MNSRRRTFLLRTALLAAALPLLPRALLAQSGPAAPGAPAVAATPAAHTVLSCNIRVALPEDDATGNGWRARRELCIDVIAAQQPDIICLQEVLREQIEDLQRAWPKFGSFGFDGPEMDARRVGYHGIAKNPIMYSRERYELVTAGGFWLSETPHLPGSLSWGSARARHVNWIRLRDRATRREFRVVNTHLDHQSQPARVEQIKLILAEAALYAPDFPQLFAGDFNAPATNPVVQLVLEAGWTSTQTASPGPRDEGNTVHGFLGANYKPKTAAGAKRGPIDFIFTRGPISTLDWKIIRDSRDGRYPSDHYFIAARVTL